jgi:hypothetical protein
VSADPYEWDFSEYDIYVATQQVDDGFEAHFNYRTALFRKETIQHRVDQYVKGFKVLGERHDLKLGAIPQL